MYTWYNNSYSYLENICFDKQNILPAEDNTFHASYASSIKVTQETSQQLTQNRSENLDLEILTRCSWQDAFVRAVRESRNR